MNTAKQFADSIKEAKAAYARDLRRQFGDDAALHRYSDFVKKREHFDDNTMASFEAVLAAEDAAWQFAQGQLP